MSGRKWYGDASFAADIVELQSLHVTGNYLYGKQTCLALASLVESVATDSV